MGMNAQMLTTWPPAAITFGQQTTSLQLFSQQLALPPNGLRLFPSTTLGWLYIGRAHVYLLEYTISDHHLLKHAQRLINIVISYKNLQNILFRWSVSAMLYVLTECLPLPPIARGLSHGSCLREIDPC